MLHGPTKTMSVLSWPRGELRIWESRKPTEGNTGLSPVYSINCVLPLHSVSKLMPFILWTALSLIVKSSQSMKLLALHYRYRCHTLDKQYPSISIGVHMFISRKVTTSLCLRRPLLHPWDLVGMGVRVIFKGWDVLHNKEQTPIKVNWVGHCYNLDKSELWQRISVTCMDNSNNLVLGTVYTAPICPVIKNVH